VTTAPRVTTTTAPAPAPAQVATAIGRRVAVRDQPDGSTVRTLANPIPSGAPLTFLVTRQQGTDLEVLLPTRPNGSTGWISADDVTLAPDPYRVVVQLGAHRLVASKGNAVVLDTAIGVGTKETPTPGGRYYIKELLRPSDPNGPYGPYAYGLSGFSNVLTEFAGGDGVIGIHGTDEPQLVGTDVSHGCIRLRNEDIEKLVPLLPLGTPVEIQP
jgi:lipoprotein-anchoring transpeptidase ErfK/SrfK